MQDILYKITTFFHIKSNEETFCKSLSNFLNTVFSNGERRMTRTFISFFVICLILFLTSCGGNEQSNKESDYEQTKRMVIDILQTDEGKKAIHELIEADDMKEHLVIESDVVKEVITENLSSDKSKK